MTRALMTAGALMALAACGKKDSRIADSAAGINAAQTLAAQQRAPGPGELTKPLAEYSGEEFYQLTQSLQYAGASERTRRCRGQRRPAPVQGRQRPTRPSAGCTSVRTGESI